MIVKVELQWDKGVRYVCLGNEKYVGLTAGTASYVNQANMEYGGKHCHVLMGRYCSLAHRIVFEVGLNHDYHRVTTYPFEDIAMMGGDKLNHYDNVNHNQIIIGNDVWIGCDVTILGGVRIGNGVVIGAGTVVAKDVPPYAVVVGNPGRIIKYRFTPEQIARLQEIKWWYWPEDKIKEMLPLMDDVDLFLEKCKDMKIHRNIEDEAFIALQQLKKDGYQIYYIIADIAYSDRIWYTVLKDFLKSFTVDDKVLLLIEIMSLDDNEIIDEMTELVSSYGDSAPLVLTHHNEGDFNPALLDVVDLFITTKNAESSLLVDFLNNKAKMIYGLDYGGEIFSRNKMGEILADREAETRQNMTMLTIGIPTYNRLCYLKKSLHYICEAVGNDDRVEIFVADNCSTKDVQDFMLQEVKKYSNIRYVRHEKNGGATFNYEYIRREAKGEYVWIVGDDDYYKPMAIKAALKSLSYNHDWSVLCLLNKDSDYQLYNDVGIDSFIRNISFIATAISSWIVKKDSLKKCDYEKIKYNNPLVRDSLIPQLVLVLDVLKNNASYGILQGRLYEPDNGESVFTTPEQFVEMGKKSGLPDLGTVFIHEYFSIIDLYKKCGIKDETIKADLKRVLNNMIIPWCRLISERKVRWQAKNLLKWYDFYYKKEDYYVAKRRELEELLRNTDMTIAEDHTDVGKQFD